MTSEIILQAIVTGLMMGLIYALIAAGLSLIFGLMEIVNFAHGEHLMLSMFSSFWLWSLLGLDPLFSIASIALEVSPGYKPNDMFDELTISSTIIFIK